MNRDPASTFRLLSTPALVCLLLAAATFAVYFPVIHFGFVDYDDSTYFFANPHVLGGLTRANLEWTFTSGDYSNWHPLTWLSLMLDATLFGKGAAAPHITNILLHAANAILVFLLFRRLTGAPLRSAALAMLFAIHPLHVESVAWVSERKDVLSGFFGLLSLLCYAKYTSGNSSLVTRHLSLFYWLALVLFACGLMSKPMLVTLPFVMLLLDFWPLQRAASPARLVIEKTPFLLLAVLSSLVTFLVQQKGGATTMLTNVPPALRVENAFVSYARYLAKIFCPVDLAAPYPHPGQWPMLLVLFSIVLFAALCVTAVTLRKKFPFAFTGWFWFAGMLVPVIGLVQVGMPAMADRYVYLPIIGILIIVIWGAEIICARWQPPRPAIVACAVILFIACGLRARNQAGTWENDGALFGHAAAVTRNNYIASLNLAFWYSNHGRVQDALACYDQAMQMSSNDLTALSYSKHDRLQEALYCYYNALRLNPDDPTELYNIGNGFAKLGYWDEAIRDYRHALEITPDQPDILDNLGYALSAKKEYADAITNFQEALSLKPDSAGAHNNLATVYFIQGRYAEAAQQFEAARQLSPQDARICANLGGTYVRLGQTNLAVKCYQQALHLQPDNPQLRAELKSLGVKPSN